MAMLRQAVGGVEKKGGEVGARLGSRHIRGCATLCVFETSTSMLELFIQLPHRSNPTCSHFMRSSFGSIGNCHRRSGVRDKYHSLHLRCEHSRFHAATSTVYQSRIEIAKKQKTEYCSIQSYPKGQNQDHQDIATRSRS
jgi:hypothetical protein